MSSIHACVYTERNQANRPPEVLVETKEGRGFLMEIVLLHLPEMIRLQKTSEEHSIESFSSASVERMEGEHSSLLEGSFSRLLVTSSE